jgi:dTDP-4-amino-4,6-dideoxygalactose transaminase
MTQDQVVPFLDLPRHHREFAPAFAEILAKALATGQFIGGPEVAGFEAEFAAYVGAAQCAGVGSGTDALRLALAALGLGPGDVALTVPNTFIATVEAVSQVGAVFEFVDVEPASVLMDPGRVEDHIKARDKAGKKPLKAVIPVHLYGNIPDMESLRELSRRHGFILVEDACQAHGAARGGKRAGSLADAAAFSFYPGKNLGALGEAGAVTSASAEVIATVKCLRDHGQQQKYLHRFEGTNARLDAIQAAFLRLKLARLEAWNERRRAVAARYDAAFAGTGAVAVLVPEGVTPSRHLYVVHLDERDKLAAHLNDRGIRTGLHYPVPLHLQPCYAHLGGKPGDFPNAERSAARLLSLPISPEITDEQADRVIAAVLEFAGRA